MAAVPTAPGLARSFVRRTLRAWVLGDLAADAEIIASELVTNAVKATEEVTSPLADRQDAAIVVQLQVRDDALRISVKDTSREQPVLQAVGDDAEGGRGLFLVEALSMRWDSVPAYEGKVTWADLALGKAAQHVPRPDVRVPRQV
ncbi:ATP-binding protein [Streptomyces sp. NPDC021020]|uniref:ATP-binding protein n=1 Tax=Streptomyces sp. NPDC021020 TaxID=3365109 RepID=UPI0037AFD80C